MMQKPNQSNRPILFLFTGFLALVSACGNAERPVEESAHPNNETVLTEVTITGNDRMEFSPEHFTVKAGETIKLKFDNIGKMPKHSMGHNLAILKPGTNVNGFAAAALGHAGNRYIAPQYEDKVIAATDVLGPGESEVIRFTAPETPGEYPFVCSFPGHTQANMRGIMTVVP